MEIGRRMVETGRRMVEADDRADWIEMGRGGMGMEGGVGMCVAGGAWWIEWTTMLGRREAGDRRRTSGRGESGGLGEGWGCPRQMEQCI